MLHLFLQCYHSLDGACLTTELTENTEMMEVSGLNEITNSIIGAAIQVHRVLGPGLLESAYEACLAFELTQRGLKMEQQKPLPVIYNDISSPGYKRFSTVSAGSVISVVRYLGGCYVLARAED